MVQFCSNWFKIFISRHGCPEGIISDFRSQFKSKFFTQLCECYNIKKIETSPYHHQANGKVEKFIGYLKRTLALVTRQDALYKRNEILDNCLLIYRVSINRTLSDTPFYFMHGRDAQLPQDIKNHVKNNPREIYLHDKSDQNYQFVLTNVCKRNMIN